MGDAQRKLEKSGERVEIRLADNPFGYTAKQIEASRRASEKAKVEFGGVAVMTLNALRNVALAAVGAAFPQGMGRADGRIWGAWQDALDADDGADRLVVTRGQVDWLAKHVGSDDIRLPAEFAQARETVADYLAALRDAPALVENGAGSQPVAALAAPAAQAGEVASA